MCSPPSKTESAQNGKYEALVGQERSALEAAKRELEHCRAKIEGLSHDVIHFSSSSRFVLTDLFSYTKQGTN